MRNIPASALSFVAALIALVSSAPRATADVSVTLDFWHGYTFYYLATSLTATNPAPVTYHRLESPSGAIWRNRGTNNASSSLITTNDLNAVINECTNGFWKLYLNKDDVSETVYYFSVSIEDLTTNVFGDITVVFPTDGSFGVTNQPTFHFTGPSHLPLLSVQANDDPGFTTFYTAVLPATSTNWTPSGPLVPGGSSFFVNYRSNDYSGISVSVPTNGMGSPLSGWTSDCTVRTYAYSTFNVAAPSGGGHTLEAHYSFEDGQIFATDYSGKENDISSISSTGGGTRYTTNDPAIGNYAAQFDNNGDAGGGWLNAPASLLPTLQSSFSVSLWVQTTQVSGDDTDVGLFDNAGLVSAFTGPGGNWVVPMAITGSKVAFATGGSPQHTLHSSTSITNDSAFVHIAVTRDHTTGQKKIYINGELDASGAGSTMLLDSPTALRIGFNNGAGLMGAMDEIQFYSGVLSADDVAFLYDNPGSTVPDVGGSPLGEAVDAPQLPWTSGGEADWFPQTVETSDGNDAAQSGAIDHDQSSWIQTTVEGPGYFSFWWKISSDDFDGYDYLEFTVDDEWENEISGEADWDYYEVYLEPGTHTLRWTYWKDSDFVGGSDAAWLDEVIFTPEIDVSLTLTIQRSIQPDGEMYHCYPSFSYVSPNPVTSHEVESFTGAFWGDTTSSSSGGFSTLQELIDELEAGPWTIYINRGDASERQYTFDVTVHSLSTTDLPPVTILSPALWAAGVPNNHPFTWTGPGDYSYLSLNSYLFYGGQSGGFTNLPVATTNWTAHNPLVDGTNGFLVNYYSWSFADVELSDPVDGSAAYFSSWGYSVDLNVSCRTYFVVGGTVPPIQVEILNAQRAGTDFMFSMLTETGRSHTIQSRTNMNTAPWIDITNFTGDGNLWQFFFPIGTDPETYFRVGTQ